MADTTTDEEAGAESTEESTEETSTEETADEDGGGGAESTDASKDEEGETTDDEEEADDGKEPETRKKPIDFILARKDKTIAKLKGKDGAGKAGSGNTEGEGDDDDEEDDVALEDKELVVKTMMPIIEPLLKQNAAQENEKELSTFLSTNPDFKPFEAKIRRYMEHPNRAGVPVKAIAYEVAGDKLMQIGAKRAKEADTKAAKTQAGGGTNREGGGSKSAWDMTPEEFAASQAETRSKMGR